MFVHRYRKVYVQFVCYGPVHLLCICVCVILNSCVLENVTGKDIKRGTERMCTINTNVTSIGKFLPVSLNKCL